MLLSSNAFVEGYQLLSLCVYILSFFNCMINFQIANFALLSWDSRKELIWWPQCAFLIKVNGTRRVEQCQPAAAHELLLMFSVYERAAPGLLCGVYVLCYLV